jgi:F-type H+-transporting ATPase subunit b
VRTLFGLLLAAALCLAPSLVTAEPAHGDEAGQDTHAAADGHGDAHAADTHAGDHHGPEFDAGAIVRHSVNLAILLAVLFFAMKTPVADFLKFRRSMVKEQLDASGVAKEEADAKFAELEQRLADFDTELEAIMAGVRADAAEERKRTLAQAERSAAQLATAADRTVDEELRRTRTELRDEVVERSVELAAALLKSSVDATDQQRLNADYLGKVEEAART